MRMKTTLIISIAAVIAVFVFTLGGVESAITGLLAFGIVILQAYEGYYFEGKKSIPHALAGPVILASFLFVAKMQTLAFIVLMVWLGFTIYLGYKAEID